MKAYTVRDKDGDGTATVVFAESRNAAKSVAMYTDACGDLMYMEIRATREPALDKFYKEGKKEMDWNDPEDRAAMVRYAGYGCGNDFVVDLQECEKCPGHEWCWRYESETEADYY